MRRLSALSAIVLLAVAGCTATPGNPLPAPNTSTSAGQPQSTTGSEPVPDVPKVTNAIDTSRFKEAPCDALTTSQITELFGAGVEPKTDLTGSAGPACRLHSPSTQGADLSIIFGSLSLTDFYRGKSTTYPFFREMPAVEGYPVVAYDISGDKSNEGRCQVAVGTSDTSAVGFGIKQAEANIGKKNACDAAREVAAMALTTIRGGN